jgi:hypothetical protein
MTTRGSPCSRGRRVWRGLVMKAENAVPFVPAMTRCEVVERRENQLVREGHGGEAGRRMTHDTLIPKSPRRCESLAPRPESGF